MKDNKVTLAIYVDQSLNWKPEMVFKFDEQRENHPDYVRISEPVEVEFQPRAHDELVTTEVAAIDLRIEKIKAEAGEQIAELQGRKQELLAIST